MATRLKSKPGKMTNNNCLRNLKKAKIKVIGTDQKIADIKIFKTQ